MDPFECVETSHPQSLPELLGVLEDGELRAGREIDPDLFAACFMDWVRASHHSQLLDQTGEVVQRARYMTLETITPISDNPIVILPAVAT